MSRAASSTTKMMTQRVRSPQRRYSWRFARDRHFALGLPLALALTACAAPSHQGDADTSSSTTDYVFGETAPEPGAPDEFCEPFDPARVYVSMQFNITQIIDPEAPEKLCVPDIGANSSDVMHPRLDGGDGSLVWLAGSGSLFRLLYIFEHEVNGEWRPQAAVDRFGELFRPFNDAMRDRIVPCSGGSAIPPVIVWSDGAWYGRCHGVTSGPDGTIYRGADYGATIDPSFLPVPVGIFENLAIFATDDSPSGYAIGGDELTPLPLPAGVDAIEHLAARSDQGGLLAAIEVTRGNVQTLERARVTAQGVELLGAYDDDLLTLAPYGIEYAIDGSGALWRLGGTESSEPVATVIRLGPSGPAEVVYEVPDGLVDDNSGRLRLLSASVGRLELLQ